MKPKTILVIDDDKRNTYALSAVLSSRGYNCITASGMNEGFTFLKDNSPVDIILIDMMMPEMDGYEALPNLKSEKSYSHIPVIAVTAQAMPGDREKCIAAGADDYVAKPVDVDILLSMLDKYLT